MTANATLDALIPASALWDVFSSDGRYMGQVALPPQFTLKRIKGYHAYGVETGELDVPHVVRLKLRPNSPSSVTR